MAGNCQKLKFNRRRLGLSQKQFADLVGLNVNTIVKLERDETAWATVRSSTVDRIMAHYDSMASWQPNKEEVRKVILESEEPKMKPVFENLNDDEPEVVEEVKEPVHNDCDLTDKDRQLMKYVEFACGNLRESKSHEEFVTNIDILKRIIKNQY